MSTPPTKLREAHAHLHSLGESLELLSLAECRSVGECLEVVAAAAAAARASAVTGQRPFVRLAAARVNAWGEGRWPTLAELDHAAGGVACVIMSFDHHAAVANSEALAAAGLKAGERVPPAGEVVAELGTGRATGLLMEQAAFRAWDAAPAGDRSQQRRRILAALRHLESFGFDEVHDLHSQEWLGPLLADLERSGELPLRVTLFPPVARLAADASLRSQWESSNVRLGGGKVFADGTLNSRTALMIHRFAEPLPGLPRGQAMVSPMAMEQHIRDADALGLTLAVHAIGDCAVRMVLDAFERVSPRTSGFRVEHGEVIDAADVPRFARLGVVCSVQPCHLLCDVEALQRFLPHRLDRVLPLRELIDAGCRPGELLWFGSDVPIVPADPTDSIQAAVHRGRRAAHPEDAIAPRQAITEAEAWACFRGKEG